MSNGGQDEQETFPGELPPVVGFRPELYGFPEGLESLSPDDGSIGGLETQCGALWDAQNVELYDGTLGVSREFVNNRQSAVGLTRWNDNLRALYTDPGSVNGARWCSGTLIADDLFLTAGHAFDDRDANGWRLPRQNGTTTIIPPVEVARNQTVEFNFQTAAEGGTRSIVRFPIIDLIEHRQGGLDYAIARLAGNPGALFGVTDISANDAALNDLLCLIGHPAGMPKQIEAGPATGFTTTRIQYGDIDTLGGNSGSALLAANGRIVGVHTNGGCTPTGGFNVGVRISALIGASPVISSIAGGDGEGEFYATDGAGGIRMLTRWPGLRRTWRHIVPGVFGGSHFTDLLFYDASTGDAEFYATSGSGGMSVLRRHPGLRQTWRHIVPGHFGGASYTDLFFYDPTTGEGEFYTTERGGLTMLSRITGFARNWTHIIPGEFGGSGHTDLFFYDPTAGVGEIYATDGAGGMTQLQRFTGMRRTWQAIVPGQFGGGPYTDLLFYDPTAGEVEIYTADSSGAISLLGAINSLRNTWKHIIPGNFGGSLYTDLFFYDPVGDGEFYTTDGAGGLAPLGSLSGLRTTWRHVVPGDFGQTGTTGLLFFDPRS